MNAKQLKNAILQLAIQGKLVPQDPTDEPASALLAQIRKEKEQLVKAGKLKKKDLETTPITDEEKPFEIPESWEWCRLGVALDVRDGTHDSPKYFSEGYPLITSKNLKNGIIDFSTALLINENDYIKINDRSRVDDGDILYAMIGSIGNPAIVKKDRDFAIKNMALFKNVKDGVFMPYVFYFLELAQYSMREYASGGVQSFVSLGYLRNYIFPLPPLTEQHRIVAKIEELMPLVEEYGEAQEKLNQLNEALPEALKKSILQQAIQGKLVPQDPADEPASVLLAQIRKEKEQLLKAGKLKPACRQAGKKDLETTPISDEEKPFEIPESWEWVRLKEITDVLGGYAFQSQDIKGEKGTRVIRISDFNENGWVNNKIARYNDKEQLNQFEIKINDILLAMTGGTVGKSFFIETLPERMLLNQRVALIRSLKVVPEFVDLLIKSPLIQNIINERKNSTNDNISMGDITGFVIPLPPLSEQHRIVAKIEELMGMVEEIR